MLEHIERLKTFQLVDLPEGLGRHIHQNRLLKLAREGGQMTPKDLGKFEPQRRYATTAAVVLESTATVIDELVDLHDRILVKLFSGAKHKHQQQFQKQGKAINDKVRLYSGIGQALLEAKESGSDPYAAIEAVIPRTSSPRASARPSCWPGRKASTTCTWSARTSPPCAVTRRPCWRCWNCAPRRPRKACWQPCRPCVR
ncbi:hypothetical protein [Enterobacter cloacae]|uniref:hypothetical protein n=1 Tax=Enterobacter cloacae TaxID=550 RepID=UPI00388D2C14